ncbi:hypothetical protein BDD12DRAFT_854993 [Trichophaea hybrida]|nr:hypothetical protein BDD12DRAFT_854993 [Trichophaea hybrida]
MAASPVIQERARPTFSLRYSLSTRRPKNSVLKASAEQSTWQKSESPPRLPPLSTSFLNSTSKFDNTSTTTESVSLSPSKDSKDVTVSLVSVDATEASTGIHSTVSVSTQPKITLSTFAKPSESNTSYQHGGLEGSSSDTSEALVDAKSHPISDSLASLPWNSPAISRSPSPSSRDERNSRDEVNSTTASSISSSSPTKSDGIVLPAPGHDSPTADSPKLTRSNTFGRRSRRLLFSKNVPSTENPPPIPITIKSASTDRIPALSSPASFKKVKDEMWEAYKTLEADYHKFQNKSNQQKTNIVRQSLLPILRKYKDKSSSNISPEALEKRTRSLHRWWTGLLTQLQNRNTQALPGADRPAYLEAVSYIMSQPEWRTAPSTFAPLADRLPISAKSMSSTSLSSASSNFSLQKSVQHNIKVLFIRTLYDTLAYVIEKMALRSAPPVLVAFAGKVIAYAFYFCPSVAEMLISLWGLQPATLRRVRPQFGIGRSSNFRNVSDEIVCEFPESLHSLGFSTLASLVRQLKNPTKPPLGVHVDWNGPWTSRWCGRDSDLLFVFFKWYHILMSDFLPPDATHAARLCTPGYVHVLAQMLSLIDTTIHRNLAAVNDTSSTTFEDLLNATAALPIPIRNTGRTMAENKLVILLQDVLFGGHWPQASREYYTTSFVAMLKAAVQRTQLYDADACFLVCDLIEQVLPILARAEKQGLGDYIDWKFWLQVAQTMLKSENNMTELRVISFVYTIWDILVEDERRKKIVCVDWLLSVPIWKRFFCHWCPMVRAYYMRLICWRLGRYDGTTAEVDVEVFKTMLLRLRTGYAYHTRLKRDYENFGGKPSSTAPCLPAPSRRLVILRNDTIAAPQGVLLDGIVPTSVPFVAAPGSLLQAHSTTSLASFAESEANSETSAESVHSNETGISTSRRWSQIRSVFGFKPAATPEKQLPAPTTPPRTSMSSVSWVGTPPHEKSQPKIQANFKFSLEWIDRPVFGRERILGLSRLPAPAQRYLDSILDFPVVEVPSGTISNHWTYVGRALAEWVLVIVEYESFFDRRKMEGRETDRDVETPSLCVEPMRRF